MLRKGWFEMLPKIYYIFGLYYLTKSLTVSV